MLAVDDVIASIDFNCLILIVTIVTKNVDPCSLQACLDIVETAADLMGRISWVNILGSRGFAYHSWQVKEDQTAADAE
jgi:hypothetical protein